MVKLSAVSYIKRGFVSWGIDSFLCRHHFQSLITCSVQIRMGKASEIRSRVVSSNRQEETISGGYPTVIVLILCRPISSIVNNERY